MRWVDNVNTDLMEIGCEGGRWIELSQDNVQWQILVSLVLNLQVLLPLLDTNLKTKAYIYIP
jgi:hypothetical protein